jgi:hypothetical protein
MKYKVIIQELKASNDKNVRAFVRETGTCPCVPP